VEFKLIWFDSFGAKSSCTLVKTKDISILIDPGIAIMHPSFPAPFAKKVYWKEKGKRRIIKAAKSTDVIVISHYHWDHFLPNRLKIYENKVLFAKNPNEYINDSQRARALEFFSRLWKKFGKREIDFQKQKKKEFKDVGEKLKSVKKKFGDYDERRKELLKKGKKWFLNRVKKWKKYKIVPQTKFSNLEIIYPEGKEFKFGRTKIKFTFPLFHGIEYSRVGWVFSTVIEEKGEKLVHSSDLNGPIIEDYAEWIIRENPDYLILDGPMTYMLGYTLNLINLRRCIENVKKIVRKVNFKLLIWDHHLPREPKFREHTKEVWELAKELDKKVLSASEFELKRKPVVEELS